MGWWRNSEGNILGDGPADTLDDALQALRSDTQKAPMELVLAGIGSLLRSRAGVYAADSGNDFRLVARSAGREIDETGSLGEPQLRVLADALDNIANDYRISELDRLPTVEEVVATLSFILGSRPERLVEGAAAPVRVAIERSTPWP